MDLEKVAKMPATLNMKLIWNHDELNTTIMGAVLHLFRGRIHVAYGMWHMDFIFFNLTNSCKMGDDDGKDVNVDEVLITVCCIHEAFSKVRETH